MFNNYAKLSHVHYEMRDNTIVELIIEQLFATSFDDIYTMHIYHDRRNSNKFVVDVAFELRTNTIVRDDDNDEYRIVHSYDMRVNIDISNSQFDQNEICNTIEFVKFKIVHRNAYITHDYSTHYYNTF